MSVRTLVKSIQDIMRQDTGVDGDAQRISQLCWMFFLKIIDDQDQELELLDPDYHSPIPGAGDRRRVVRDVFEDAYNYMKSGQLMRQVINKITGIDFNNLAERQHFGEIYEQVLNDLQ